MRMLAHHPIFGSGLSGFASAINPYRNGYAELQIYPHNILLNFWAETGILGLVAFGWLMVKTFIATLAGWIHGSSGWRPYQLGVLLFVVAVLGDFFGVDPGEAVDGSVAADVVVVEGVEVPAQLVTFSRWPAVAL